MASTSRPAPVFDLDAAWRLHPQVSVRPESFGALLYHFGTRRLSFLKSPAMATIVTTLADHDSARSACLATGGDPETLATYDKTLAVLARSSMICRRAPGDETPVDGTPGNGTPGNGTPGNGTPGNGTPADERSADERSGGQPGRQRVGT